MPTLYVVATPIGNLEDITLRALRVLKKVSLIAAEDTRKTRKLLTAYRIGTPLTSYYEHNKLSKLADIMQRLEQADVALVSEAGMPGISDPGYELVAAAIERGFTVVPIPGPTALATAVAVSGLPTDRFLFVGFLPVRQGPRHRALEALAGEKATLVCYEAPHRIRETLADILETLGDRRVAVCRELTKLHEETFRGTVSEAIEHFTEPRGEFTLVVEGNREIAAPLPSEDMEQEIERLRRAGKTAREAMQELSGRGYSRKDLYRLWLKQTRG